MNQGRRDAFQVVIPRHIRIWMGVAGFLVAAAASFWGIESVESVVDVPLSLFQVIGLIIFGGLAGAVALAVITPAALRGIVGLGRWMETRLTGVPLSDILVGVFGLIFGLIIANLLGSALSQLPIIGGVATTAGAILFGYLGWVIAVNKKPDLVSWGRAIRSSAGDLADKRSAGSDPENEGPARNSAGTVKVVDSSTIIDGRIADVCRSGFLEGPLLIPEFVLEEVQRIADSSDPIKRNRGRRGLDILNTIQKEMNVEVQIHHSDGNDEGEVDSRLLELARRLDGSIITNDYNLNKVAGLQGVEVLNINELANALKPMVIPGEQLTIRLIKDGKEPGQGVGYLDDGTMVVVDEGRTHIGEEISVSVTSVLQTSAGRMIFARPEDLANAAP